MRKDLTSKKKALARELRKKSTPQEIIFWSKTKGRKFRNLKFRRQHLLGKYVVDFICLEKKLIIELDGYQHKEEERKTYDIERTLFLERMGFKIIRFWNNEINNNLDGVFLRI
jgi:very-short-patch-repair endonuclease